MSGCVLEAVVGRIDVRMATAARGARGMGGGGRIAVAGAAAGRQVVRLAPDGRLIGAAGDRCSVAVSVGALFGCFVISRARPIGKSQSTETDGSSLDAGCSVTPVGRPVEV